MWQPPKGSEDKSLGCDRVCWALGPLLCCPGWPSGTSGLVLLPSYPGTSEQQPEVWAHLATPWVRASQDLKPGWCRDGGRSLLGS